MCGKKKEGKEKAGGGGEREKEKERVRRDGDTQKQLLPQLLLMYRVLR